jgi:hypothetical protein
MPLVRPVDSSLHGVVDYTVGSLLMTVLPRLAGVQRTPSARQIRAAGAFHTAYSTVTDYELGLAKVLPFRAHLALDALGALALGVTPFVTGQYRRGPRQWAPHVVLCAFELSALALTDPSGRGEVEAVREANPLTSEDDSQATSPVGAPTGNGHNAAV